jgi:hypothetical protein
MSDKRSTYRTSDRDLPSGSPGANGSSGEILLIVITVLLLAAVVWSFFK